MTISSDYESLTSIRQPYIDTAIESALFTSPSLFFDPDVETEDQLHYRNPDSSIGATGLNNLASTLLVAIFPSNVPFLRSDLNEESIANLRQENPDAFKDIKSEIDQSLRKIDNSVLEILESDSTRADLYEILRQYLLGQVLIFQDPDTNKIKGFKLSKFVNVRDAAGNVFRYIVKEYIDPRSLSEDILKEIDYREDKSAGAQQAKRKALYTDISRRDDGTWLTAQYFEDKIIKSTKQEFTQEDLPWFDIGFNRVTGASYASGFIEGLLGDLKSANYLRRAIVEGSKISARTIFAVNPASNTSIDELIDTPNGGFFRGLSADVVPLYVNKSNDFAVALNAEAAIKQDLNRAFMSQVAASRDAERVTAAEFTTLAEEINKALGGTFSRLSVELQQPLARLTLEFMKRKGIIKDLSAAGIKTTIITGISALGRGNDRTRIGQLIQDVREAASVPGLQSIGSDLVSAELLLRIINANSVNASNLLRTKEDKAAEAEAAQRSLAAQQASDNGTKILQTSIANPEGAQIVGDMFAKSQGVDPQSVADGTGQFIPNGDQPDLNAALGIGQ